MIKKEKLLILLNENYCILVLSRETCMENVLNINMKKNKIIILGLLLAIEGREYIYYFVFLNYFRY